MNLIRRVFDYKGAPVLTAVFLILFIAEGKRRLRNRVQPRTKRMVINTLVSLPSFMLLRFLFLPIMIWLAVKNRKLQIGLNYQHHLPPAVKGAIAFLLMDYTNYLWHVLNHKLPMLSRFHLVHDSDPDLDVTTALRIHFCELIGSIFYRGAFAF